MFKLSFN